MFVRTERLTLRPAWPEDAPELAQAIGHESVVRNLALAPWPYTVADAQSFTATFGDPTELKFLAFEHVDGRTRLIGGMGIGPFDGEPHSIGYWIAPHAWGRGFATEAGAAMLRSARAMGVRHVAGSHFVDNPASGRVLRKLGFRPTGEVKPLHSRGRGREVPSISYALDLSGESSDGIDPDARMAA